MQLHNRELNGIFQAECHTSANRLLWIVLVAMSLCVIAYGAWAIESNIFELSQETRLRYFEIVLQSLLFFILPVVILAVGLIKIVKKPGMYLIGARIAEKKVEIGRFFLDIDPVPAKKIWDNERVGGDWFGEWKQIKQINTDNIKIYLVVSNRYESSKHFFLNQVVLSSRDNCLYKMDGHDSSGTHRHDMYAISQGSLHLLGSDDGICPDELLSFRERTASIISGWKHSLVLSCTLKIVPSLANFDSMLAFGVLGGVKTSKETSINSREYQVKICDSLDDEKTRR